MERNGKGRGKKWNWTERIIKRECEKTRKIGERETGGAELVKWRERPGVRATAGAPGRSRDTREAATRDAITCASDHRVGSKRLFQALDLYWRSQESGDSWYTSMQLKKTI